MVKKILWAVIVIIILGVIALSIWFFFFRGNGDETTIPEDESGNFFPTVNPDPLQDNSDTPSNIEIGNKQDSTDRSDIPTLRQLSMKPVSGAISFERLGTSSETILNQFDEEILATTSETIFRYIERGTGHLYETKDNSLTKVRLSNVTIPRIYKAQFDTTGDNVLLEYLEETLSTTETFKATLTENDTEDTELEEGFALEGQFMPKNILATTLSPTGNRIAYLTKQASSTTDTIRGSELFISSFDTNQTSSVYKSPISEWNISWPATNIISLETKPHSSISGFLYYLNIDNGRLTKIIENARGLTTLSNPTATKVLFSISTNNQISLNIGDIEDDTFERLDIATFPEKCVWSKFEEDVVYCGAPALMPRAPYPESWYQGEVSFNDNIWKVNLEENTYEIVFQTSENENSFDIIHPILSEKDEYFIFIDKNDLSLWSLDLRG